MLLKIHEIHEPVKKSYTVSALSILSGTDEFLKESQQRTEIEIAFAVNCCLVNIDKNKTAINNLKICQDFIDVEVQCITYILLF